MSCPSGVYSAGQDLQRRPRSAAPTDNWSAFIQSVTFTASLSDGITHCSDRVTLWLNGTDKRFHFVQRVVSARAPAIGSRTSLAKKSIRAIRGFLATPAGPVLI